MIYELTLKKKNTYEAYCCYHVLWQVLNKLHLSGFCDPALEKIITWHKSITLLLQKSHILRQLHLGCIKIRTCIPCSLYCVKRPAYFNWLKYGPFSNKILYLKFMSKCSQSSSLLEVSPAVCRPEQSYFQGAVHNNFLPFLSVAQPSAYIADSMTLSSLHVVRRFSTKFRPPDSLKLSWAWAVTKYEKGPSICFNNNDKWYWQTKKAQHWFILNQCLNWDLNVGPCTCLYYGAVFQISCTSCI